jgi:RNA polymerase sigma-70 factor (ECF subfamily)
MTEPIEELFERHRRELVVHCYRMMGSYSESEDIVQETFIRAIRSYHQIDDPSSVRAWLYKIATNACIDALRRRNRSRFLPFDVMDPVRGPGDLPTAGDHLWLEPFPDRLLVDDPGADPGEEAVHRETMELVFLAAVQHLPPLQRAVFISRDVMGWSAKATAVLLDTSQAAVKSALQRARAVIREHVPDRREEWDAATEVSEDERRVVRRYIDAHRQDSIESLAEVLADDVRIAYPGIPLWSDSRDAFLQATREFAPPGEYRFVATSANLQPAVAIYLRAPGDPAYRLTALELLRIENGKVTEIVDFDPGGLSPEFGLEPTLQP